LTFHANPIYEINRRWLFDKGYRIACNQGGTRSGKTYNIIILLISLALSPESFGYKENSISISVVSQSLPHLKKGAIRDFLKIMKEYELYSEADYNRTDNVYNFSNGSYIEFFSVDDDKKVRGPGRKVLFVNEANTIAQDIFMQLNLRTESKIIIDYNPSDLYSYIYDEIIPRKDCAFIKSSFTDNMPFLPKELVEEIKKLKDADENLWNIYGLGERGQAQEIIYSNWQEVKFVPAHVDETIYGLDFGYNNKMVLTKIDFVDTVPYMQTLIYASGLLNSDVIKKLEEFNVSNSDNIYCDSARPDLIQEICNAGFNAVASDKSVIDGIDYCKRQSLKILSDSVEAIKELKRYSWKKDKDGKIMDVPVKAFDHFCDSFRYALYTHSKILEPKIWIM
jgi:phage terminase large subunit